MKTWERFRKTMEKYWTDSLDWLMKWKVKDDRKWCKTFVTDWQTVLSDWQTLLNYRQFWLFVAFLIDLIDSFRGFLNDGRMLSIRLLTSRKLLRLKSLEWLARNNSFDQHSPLTNLQYWLTILTDVLITMII